MKTSSREIDARELKVGDKLDRGVKNYREVVRVRDTVGDFAGLRVNVTEVMHKHPITGELCVMNFAHGAKARVY